jgi:plasmid stability protein
MRATLNLDHEVLTVIKERAALEGLSHGKIASKLIRQALQAESEPDELVVQAKERNGFQLIQRKHPPKTPITMARIQEIADEEGI